MRHEELKAENVRLFSESFDGCCGQLKVGKQLKGEGIEVANCTVRRLMRDMGLAGVWRRRRDKVTTTSGDSITRPADLVEREFPAPAPDRLRVADLTCVKAHFGWVYVAFDIDVFSRMVVGWRTSTSPPSDLAIAALKMAIHSRQHRDPTDLVDNSDQGVQHLSIRHTERPSEGDTVSCRRQP